MNEDGGVEPGLARGLERLQCHSFSKMSRFSKFCKFLSETGEGLKLVAFFIAAQHVFVAYYEGDPDSAVHIGELRDTFFDETSYWCLPNKVLQNYATSDQSTSVGECNQAHALYQVLFPNTVYPSFLYDRESTCSVAHLSLLASALSVAFAFDFDGVKRHSRH